MFVYKISDIVETLSSMKKDGFEYVSLSIIDADSECPEDTLSIDAIISANDSENEMIDSMVLPNGYSLDL